MNSRGQAVELPFGAFQLQKLTEKSKHFPIQTNHLSRLIQENYPAQQQQ